ncbi:MAG TPA: zinc metallopeptidase [Thiothrix sp.]|nr:zinc metallopeptidase [Thiothrix sp.]
MHIILIILFIVVLVFGPQWWARHTFKRYSKCQDHIEGTGGELARHLLDRYAMEEVKVEMTETEGDHYDPLSKTVRLSPNNYHDNSLTAIAVATHEVGHAIQHYDSDRRLVLRTRLAQLAQASEKIGSGFMIMMPIMLLLTRSPIASLIFTVAGFISIAGSALMHLVTLPVEWDASFGKALPILKSGYVREEDYAAIETILKAAAFTYVAASLASLLNVWRWIALLRR